VGEKGGWRDGKEGVQSPIRCVRCLLSPCKWRGERGSWPWDYIYSSAGAADSVASSFSPGLSESCMSEVQRVKLSLSNCMMRVESL